MLTLKALKFGFFGFFGLFLILLEVGLLGQIQASSSKSLLYLEPEKGFLNPSLSLVKGDRRLESGFAGFYSDLAQLELEDSIAQKYADAYADNALKSKIVLSSAAIVFTGYFYSLAKMSLSAEKRIALSFTGLGLVFLSIYYQGQAANDLYQMVNYENGVGRPQD
mgnify:CR=1 FL=1